MRHARATLAVTAAFLASLALGADVAAAHTTSFDSRVTFRWQDDPLDFGGEFSGKVLSTRGACEPNRQVIVLRRKRGPDEYVGSDTTGPDGSWSLTVSGASTGPHAPAWDGRYYAWVRKQDIGGAEHNHICGPDRSRELRITDQAI